MKKNPDFVLPLLLQLLSSLFFGIEVNEQEILKSKDLVYAKGQNWLRVDRVKPVPSLRVRLTFVGFLAGLQAWIDQKFSFIALKSRLISSGYFTSLSEKELRVLLMIESGFLNSKFGWTRAIEIIGGSKTLGEIVDRLVFDLRLVSQRTVGEDIFYRLNV